MSVLFSLPRTQYSWTEPPLCTVPLYDSKLFISRSCLILVLTTVLHRPRRADVKKDVKNYQVPTTAVLPEKMWFQNISPIRFFKFQWDYDLNLGRYLNPELPPMRGFASLIVILGKYCTFVCGTLFGGIKLIKIYPPKQSSTYKSEILAEY
jgi:hypothetical protein